MASRNNLFTTIRTEGALLPADLIQRISEGKNVDGLRPEDFHRSGEKLNEAINRSWNALQGVWASFRAGQEKLPESDIGTTLTRERWLLPLFRELDYGRLQTASAIEIDGKSYPISHGWENVPIHLVSYKLDLDTRTPGVTGASTASPHSLVQVALNRSDAYLWGFLSNGYRLRILRDNVSLTRQAFVEFDLEAMMDGEVYSDFVLLWLLCHQSRVEGERPSDCWLEKWMKVAVDQGTRALDQLRDGVEKAITALGLGFIEHPANADLRDTLQSGDLNAQDYYRQLLRLVYRLLFLFVAEDRQIDGRAVLLDPKAPQEAVDRYMKYYSTQRLRGMAETFKGTRHPDLFEGLRLVMRLLSGDGPHPKSLSQGARDLKSTSINSATTQTQHSDRQKINSAALLPSPLGRGAGSEGSVGESGLLRRGTKDAAIYEGIASKAMVLISRDLRQRQTPAEEIMWEALRDRRLNGVKFRRQHPIAGANYVVDFLCYEAKLVVEIDGGIHGQQKDSDEKRQTEIEALGYGVIRFTNEQIRNDLQWVLAIIAHAAALPSTLGRGAGGEGQARAASGLAIVPLGSFLFSDGAVADVIDCKIANHHLLDAVRALSLTYDDRAKVYRSVDYRNLGPEELGSVYESLLELHPQINVPARRFALATAGGNERKTTGSYYTPSSLINALLDSALDPVLEEAIRPHPKSFSQGEKDFNLPSPLGRGAGGEGLTAEQRILNLKICDPACGSGHFLIAAAQRIAKALASVRTGEEEPSPVAIQEAKRDVIGRCIYGVDINPMAAELCKVNLWMEALEPGKPLSFLESHIRVGNSLLGTTPKLMADGIPDDAFNPIAGDDKKIAASLKKANREARKQREAKVRQLGLFDQAQPPADYAALNRAAAALNTMDDDTLDDLRRKEAAYKALATGGEAHKARLLADAWCAAFVWEKGARPHPKSGPHPKSLSQGERDLELDADTPDSSTADDLPSTLGRGAGGEGRTGGEGHTLPLTDLTYRWLEDALRDGRPLTDDLVAVAAEVERLRERYQFFHWHVAFPDVFPVPDEAQQAENEQTGWDGGFSCVLGNPPWEHTELKDQEWFADKRPDIANARTSAIRTQMLNDLRQADPYLYQEYINAVRISQGYSHFIRISGRFPLAAYGRINTYIIFSEMNYTLISNIGILGVIVPSGIATDSNTRHFFAAITSSGTLHSLYSFENEERIFDGIHNALKFCLLTVGGSEITKDEADYVFFARQVSHLEDSWRHFTLSAADIHLINPNTHTCATFRSKRDANLNKDVYRRVPVLLNESDHSQSPWGISFKQGLFNMSSDSSLFFTQDDLLSESYQLSGNTFSRHNQIYMPLYEAKLVHQFDHRYSTYEGATEADLNSGRLPNTTPEQKNDPGFQVLPQYWINYSELESRAESGTEKWFICFRNITRSVDFRTSIFCIMPYAGLGHTGSIVNELDEDSAHACSLLVNFNCFVLDYFTRQKAGGISLGYFIVYQLPVIPPHIYIPTLLDFIVSRVLELTYTAWDLQPFAQDVGWRGAPFVWDEERRFLMRCELDALYFHLYQIARDDVDYIMETFPIIKRKDEAAHGEYRTKRVILEMYDQMAALPTMAVPAPKDASATYLVPDVSQWQTWLSPGPADPSVAHEDTR